MPFGLSADYIKTLTIKKTDGTFTRLCSRNLRVEGFKYDRWRRNPPVLISSACLGKAKGDGCLMLGLINEGQWKAVSFIKGRLENSSAGTLPLAIGDKVARQMSGGHSQIRVSRNDRCEYATPADTRSEATSPLQKIRVICGYALRAPLRESEVPFVAIFRPSFIHLSIICRHPSAICHHLSVTSRHLFVARRSRS